MSLKFVLFMNFKNAQQFAFKNYLRLTPALSGEILEIITPAIVSAVTVCKLVTPEHAER